MKINNIAADGNCVFRVACYAAYGKENGHENLHVAVVHFVQQNKLRIVKTFLLSDKDFAQLIAKLATPDIVADEHLINVIPSILKRNVIFSLSFCRTTNFVANKG